MSMNSHIHQTPSGHFNLPKGTYPKSMCAFDKFLEIYTVDKTFKILTPDGVDPNHLDPNTPWISTQTHDIGSQNKIVSRIILQGEQILKSALFRHEINQLAVLALLHDCKEELLACEKIALELAKEIDDIISRIKMKSVKTDNGRHLSLPNIINLNPRCTSFLTHANKTIKRISKLPTLFIKLSNKDNNFKNLAKSLITAIGTEAGVTQFVNSHITNTEHIISLRNYIEHPGEKATKIENFHYLPGNKIAGPQWHVTGEEPRPIKEEMAAIVNYLLEVAEMMLIHLVQTSLKSEIQYFMEIEDSKLDPEMPIKYKLIMVVKKL